MIKKTIFFAFVMLASATMLAQTTVTGLVKDAQTGETLLGANVKVSDKTIGTTTTEYGAGIANATDGYFISAYYQGGGSGSGNKVSPDYGAQDIWVLKLDFFREYCLGTNDWNS